LGLAKPSYTNFGVPEMGHHIRNWPEAEMTGADCGGFLG
jgi:hypothetical protein